MVRQVGVVSFFFSTLASAQGLQPARRGPTLSTFGAAKARALMRDRLPCAGCHAFDGVSGGRVGPDLSRIADRRPSEYVRRMIEDPQAVVPGTVMPRVPMSAGTRDLIVEYLTRTRTGSRTAPAEPGAARRASARVDGARGAPALYRHYCAPCHGVQGDGDGPNARHLRVRPARHSDPAYMSRRSDDRLFDAIHAGGYPLGRSVTMPPYGGTLTRAEIWALVRHLRQLCRCSGPEWSTDGERTPTSARPP